MGFWSLFEVASMPILQVLLVTVLGAFLATNYFTIFTADARNSLNKIVFTVFTPSLLFASLAKTVTIQLFISWWFMPVNIVLTFLVGGILGWILVKLLKPLPYLEGIVLATCSSGNLGNLILIIIPAICNEDGSPFNAATCSSLALSYASFSMAFGGLGFWTVTYNQIRSCAVKLKEIEEAEKITIAAAAANNDDLGTHLLKDEDTETEVNSQLHVTVTEAPFLHRMVRDFHKVSKELLSPPTIGAILGFIFGAITFLRNLIIGDGAPLHVIQDSITLLGQGTIPSITLILGGNLTGGLRSSKMSPWIVVAILFVRYAILPAIGVGIVIGAAKLGFLSSDPLYQYVLMVQYAVPPAMNIGTMAQLYNVGQDECSVLFLWTYLVSAPALTIWSTVFMWILS